MKFCPNCGHQVDPADNVCKYCGHRLTPAKPVISNRPQARRTNNVNQNTNSSVNSVSRKNAKRSRKSSGKSFKIFIGICIVALIAEGGYLLYSFLNDNNSSSALQSSQNVSQSTTSANDNNGQSGNASNNNNQGNNNNSNNGSNDGTGLWDGEKQRRFDKFFENWSDEMKQDYTEYDGSGSFEAGPAHYPADFSRFYVDGQHVSIGLSKDGSGKYDYNVVDIYNHGTGEFHITYFMCFHDGQPVVLVDQTTNGDHIAAKETDNKKLSDGFAQIATGN